MKRLILVLICAIATFNCIAQNGRIVRGVVYDYSGMPLPGATLTPVGTQLKYTAVSDGTFQFEVPYDARFIEASKPGYLSQKVEIDGGYMVFKLKIDKKYEEKIAKEEAERARAAQEAAMLLQREAEARAWAAEQERLAKQRAEEAARLAAQREAEIKARAEEYERMVRLKAEEEARLAAEREAAEKARAEEEKRQAELRALEEARLAAEREAAAKARAEEEKRLAQLKAEEDARLAAEREAAAKAIAEEEERLAQLKAEEEARLAAEREAAIMAKKAQMDSLMSVKAEAKAQKKAVADAYDAQYRNKGFVHGIEAGYIFSLMERYVIYENYGKRSYSTLNPAELVYSAGYRFNNWVSVGAGAGIVYEFTDLRAYGDKFSPVYKDNGSHEYSNVGVPVFLNAKFYLSRGKHQPMVSVSGGTYYWVSTGIIDDICLELGLGYNYRLGYRSNVYVMASFKSYPYLTANTRIMSRSADFGPCLKLGITL